MCSRKLSRTSIDNRRKACSLRSHTTSIKSFMSSSVIHPFLFGLKIMEKEHFGIILHLKITHGVMWWLTAVMANITNLMVHHCVHSCCVYFIASNSNEMNDCRFRQYQTTMLFDLHCPFSTTSFPFIFVAL